MQHCDLSAETTLISPVDPFHRGVIVRQTQLSFIALLMGLLLYVPEPSYKCSYNVSVYKSSYNISVY